MTRARMSTPSTPTADLLFRPSAAAQLELAGTLALNTGIVILTYRVPAGR